MDHTCIRTVKLKQLETAAKLSAVQLVECDEYIRLAMCTEKYIANPCDELFNVLQEQLAICTNHFPKFNQSRQTLIATLLNVGYMTQDTKKPETIDKKALSTEPQIEEQPIVHNTNNVYNIFTKKKIDFPTKK